MAPYYPVVPNPLPTLSPKLIFGTAAASVDNPPFGAFGTANNIIPFWQSPAVLPTLTEKLPPSLLDVKVDNPPVKNWGTQVSFAPWVPADPQPTLPPKIVFGVQIDNPPNTQIGDIRKLQSWWDVPPPLPTLPNKLLFSIPADNAPNRQAGEIWSIQSWWNIPPPMPILPPKISPSLLDVRVDNPPVTRIGDFWTVQSWWNPPQPPQPQETTFLATEGPTIIPPPATSPIVGGRTVSGYWSRGKWRQLQEEVFEELAAALEAQALLEDKIDDLQGKKKDALQSAALLSSAALDVVETAAEAEKLANLLKAAERATTLSQTIGRANAIKAYAEMIIEQDDEDAIAVLLMSN
jgi:hypothetical protein